METGKFPEPHSLEGYVNIRIRLDLLNEQNGSEGRQSGSIAINSNDSAACGELSTYVAQPRTQVCR